MIYAIVTTYTDGHSDTIFINQKAKNATTENACLMGFIFPDTEMGHKILTISYVSKLCEGNKAHPVIMDNIEIDISSVRTVCVYNVDCTDGKTALSSLLSTPYKA